MVSKKKKIIVISLMALLLVATGVLNVVLNNNSSSGTTQVSTVTQANFFSTYRNDRQATRSQEVLYLEAIISSEASSAEAKANAEKMKLDLIDQMDSEMVCENLIMARGFDDCIVTKTGNNVNVVVKSESLNDTDINKICSVVRDVLSVTNDYIKIIPYN